MLYCFESSGSPVARQDVPLDASIGTSVFDKDAGVVTAKALMDRADQAMFEDKRRRTAERLAS